MVVPVVVVVDVVSVSSTEKVSASLHGSASSPHCLQETARNFLSIYFSLLQWHILAFCHKIEKFHPFKVYPEVLQERNTASIKFLFLKIFLRIRRRKATYSSARRDRARSRSTGWVSIMCRYTSSRRAAGTVNNVEACSKSALTTFITSILSSALSADTSDLCPGFTQWRMFGANTLTMKRLIKNQW